MQITRVLAKSGPAKQRRLAEHLGERLQTGSSIADALAAYRPALPDLFLAMVEVGEETGRLPKTLAELERHYGLQERMRRQLRGRLIVLLIQFGVACLVLAAVIGVTTTLLPRGGFTLFGLRGWGGALAFLGLAAAVVVGLLGVGRLVAHGVRTSNSLAALVQRVPGVGALLEAMLLARFALALHLTLDSSLPIARALRLAFDAAADARLTRQGKRVIDAVRGGADLSVALTRANLPLTFLEVFAVAEAAGNVPESVGHLAEQYQEEAALRSRTLIRVAGVVLWGLYAVAVIWAIFRLASMYLGAMGI